MADSDRIKDMLSKTKYLVEATDVEQDFLWQEYSFRYDEDTWKQMNPGATFVVGRLDGRPVVLTLFWVEIQGSLICFYECNSQVVDWPMIELWLDESCPGVPRTNARNFHNIYHHISNKGNVLT